MTSLTDKKRALDESIRARIAELDAERAELVALLEPTRHRAKPLRGLAAAIQEILASGPRTVADIQSVLEERYGSPVKTTRANVSLLRALGKIVRVGFAAQHPLKPGRKSVSLWALAANEGVQ